MKRTGRFLAVFLAAIAWTAGAVDLQAEAAAPRAAAANWGSIPLAFETNRGQAAAEVRFLARGSGYGVYFTDGEAVFALAGPARTAVTMTVDGRNRASRPEGLGAQAGASHYFNNGNGGNGGNGTGNGTGSVSAQHFSKVQYRNVLAGIDLVYYGFQRQIEYDFIVAPEARPADIRLDFSGAETLTIEANGDLKLTASGGEIRHRRPEAYQEIKGARHPIEVRFRRLGPWRVGFELGPYDRTFPLVIDPKVEYATYWGGSNANAPSELGYGIAVDAAGAAYVTGITTAPDFPLVSPLQNAIGGGTDAFILKINPAGTAVVAATYLGGTDDDEGHDIKLDADGYVYITGYTTSPDFPIVNGFQKTLGGGRDAFLVKLNPDASAILYSTFIGGSLEDRGYGLAVSAAGDAYVTGLTQSRNLPMLNPLQGSYAGGASDAFLTKIARDGTLAYSTYVGGSGADHAYDVAIDPDGDAYMAGYTTSVNFPRKNDNGGLTFFLGGPDDAFVVKVGPSGSLIFSLVMGGTGTDEAVGIAIDTDRNVYITGFTASADFPLRTPLQGFMAGSSDIFIAKIHSDGNLLDFSTYWGSDESEGGVGIAIDNKGYVHVTGFTGSAAFPLINAVQERLNLGTPVLVRDAFLLKLPSDGTSMVYSTYLGGRSNDGALALAVDTAGNVYLTGYTTSQEFPAIHALQPEIADLQDAFVLKFDGSDVVATINADVPERGAAQLILGGLQRSALFGYADFATATGAPRPVGLELISVEQLGTTVSELGLPVTPPLKRGRLFVENMSASLQEFVAIVNTSGTTVTFSHYFTTTVAATSGLGDISQSTDTRTFTLPANTQIFVLLTDFPFFIPPGIEGTFTFDSSEPLSVTAVRARINTQSNLILSRIPVYDRDLAASGPAIIDYLAEGQGWHTQIALVNNTDDVLTGEIRFFGPGNAAATAPLVLTTATTGAVVPYTIPPRTALRTTTQTTGDDTTLMTGFIEIAPSGGTAAPGAFAVIEQGDITAATLEAQVPRDRFRAYVEAERNWGDPLSRRTIIDMTNSSDSPLTVQFDLTDVDGVNTGLSAQIVMPPRTEIGKFLDELPGFTTAPKPFRGLLRAQVISGTGLTLTALSAFTNDKGVFLVTTTGPLREDAADAAVTAFPYIPTGAQYTTRLLLFGPENNAPTTGTVRTWDSFGRPLLLETTDARNTAAPNPWAPVIANIDPPYVVAGSTVDVTLTGINFIAGATAIDAIDGIDIAAVTVVNASTMTATFTVAPDAAGPRGVTITTNGGSSGLAPFAFFIAPVPFADLKPTRSHLGPFIAGFNASDIVTVHNVGAAATTGIYTVTSALSSGLAYFSFAGLGWTCAATAETVNQTITCTNSTPIGIGGTAPDLTLTTAVDLRATPSVTLSVTVTADDDLNTRNNTATEVTAVIQPNLPAFVFNPTTLGPAQQDTLGLTLPTSFPYDITGTITMTFLSTASVPLDDPAVQFETGQRQVTFTIPAGTLEARFGGKPEPGPIGFQTGTVAGLLLFTGTLQTGTLQTTFSPQADGTLNLSIPASAPVLQNLQVTNGANGRPAEIQITLSSTTREVQDLIMNFQTTPALRPSCGKVRGCSVSGTVLTLNVQSVFEAWYQGNTTFGGLGVLRLPISFDAGVHGTIFILLQNGSGVSNIVSFTLP